MAQLPDLTSARRVRSRDTASEKLWRSLWHDKMGRAGVIILAVSFGPHWAGAGDFPVQCLRFRIIGRLDPRQGPSRANWFGTTELGQNVFREFLIGGRISLYVGVSATLIAIVLGAGLGLVFGLLRWLARHGAYAYHGLLLSLAHPPVNHRARCALRPERDYYLASDWPNQLASNGANHSLAKSFIGERDP